MKKSIFDKSTVGRSGYKLPQTAIDEYCIDSIDKKLLRQTAFDIPSVNEFDIVRHYKNILNIDDDNIEPSVLNNEKFILPILEDVGKFDGFTGVHPYQLGDAEQGLLELMFTIEHMLDDMLGMDNFSFQAVSQKQVLFALFSIIKSDIKNKKT